MRLSALFLLSALPAFGAGATTIRLPLGFEPNAGRFADDISFLARTSDYALALQSGALRFSMPQEVLLRFEGASRVSAVAEGATAVRANYLVGNDPSSWRRDIDRSERVRYGN